MSHEDEIPQDKALEYMQVCGLICEDIENLVGISEMPEMTLDRLKRHVRRLKDAKDEAINDPEKRQRRYEAVAFVWGCVDAGLIRCEVLEP